MTDQQPVATDQQQAVANAGPKAHASKNNIDPPARHPHLSVFGPDVGAFEYELTTLQTTIGRADESDIKLHHKAVSRKHATITCEDGLYVLRDLALPGTRRSRRRWIDTATSQPAKPPRHSTYFPI